MSQIAFQAKQSLFELAARVGFVDPVTGEGPSCEEELSTLLSYFHQLGRINWKCVTLSTVATAQEIVQASDVIAAPDVALTECPFRS